MKYVIVMVIAFNSTSYAWWGNDQQDTYRQPSFTSSQFQKKMDLDFKPIEFSPVYRMSDEQIKPDLQTKIDRFSVDFNEGFFKGNFIEKPNMANALGQVAGAVSPYAIAADIRDFSVSAVKSAQTGFAQHKTEAVIAGIGFVGFVRGAQKLSESFMEGRQAANGRHGMDTFDAVYHVRQALPDLPKAARESFEGPIGAKTYKAGESVFRPANMDGARFYADQPLPNVPMEKYVFKNDVTVYAGKASDEAGQRILIPHDINPHQVLRKVETQATFIEEQKDLMRQLNKGFYR